ncbi:redoxin family protein [Algoriphagus sp. H41]|uniref:Redoxin family protein n=1 Tax=Algoriphagus oliviformis TaxID=2811231 RepID=A0ABS3C4E8_9BACT|nr:TlpA disulfide reductase family protein [Algoriphagus oliviformis]MBN7811036.1 redoxin family protein [Algoriphagus oliviformis]
MKQNAFPWLKRLTFFLFLVSQTVISQTILEGQLPSFPNTRFSIIVGISPLNDYVGTIVGEGKTDENGRFNTEVNLDSEQLVILTFGNTLLNLWMKPNTSLTVNQSQDRAYTFSGPSAHENNVLSSSGIMQPLTVPTYVDLDSFKPKEQTNYLDSLEKKRLLILEANQGVVSSKFFSFLNTEATSFSYSNKSQYIGLLKAAGKLIDQDIPKDYFSFWDEFEVQEDSTSSHSYQVALRKFIEFKTLERTGTLEFTTEQDWVEMFYTADSLLTEHPYSLQKQKAMYLLFLVKFFDFPEVTSRELKNYSKQFAADPSSLLLSEMWEKKVNSGSITPSFRLKDNNGNWVESKDFIGKVVYIDFWGAWCKACILNMPYAEQLKEKLKEKEVVFLYIDFFDSEEKWLYAIEKYNITGIHLKTENHDEQYFNDIFNVNEGFPRYALIDKKGRLRTVSAPPPNSPTAFELIEKYLNDL